jgi:hypothetical protein
MQRYAIVETSYGRVGVEDDCGDWVKYEDAWDEIHDLKRKVEALEDSIEEIHDVVWRIRNKDEILNRLEDDF